MPHPGFWWKSSGIFGTIRAMTLAHWLCYRKSFPGVPRLRGHSVGAAEATLKPYSTTSQVIIVAGRPIASHSAWETCGSRQSLPWSRWGVRPPTVRHEDSGT